MTTNAKSNLGAAKRQIKAVIKLARLHDPELAKEASKALKVLLGLAFSRCEDAVWSNETELDT